MTNFEEENIDNNIDGVEEFNIKREGALNNSLEPGYAQHNSNVDDILDPEEVLQDLEEIQELEQDSLENELRYKHKLSITTLKQCQTNMVPISIEDF